MERVNAWTTYNKREEKKVMDLGKAYRAFLDNSKTERECARETIRRAQKAGYVDLDKVKSLKAGDRVYVNTMNKAVQLYIIGAQPLEKGLNIVGAHIDSPRMDLKQNPLYEDTDLAYLDTHYYGGIKKYQWVTLPLALHGVVVKKDGTVVDVIVGEDEADPVVGISDLLIHLSATQMDKKASVVIEGEALDVIVGGKPQKDVEKEPVKAAVLALLKEKYGMEEEDFLSAEIEVVPAGKSRDFGLDRSMIMGYGHDDRVCAYAEIEAMFQITGTPQHTCCCILADKEEIGSVGATGMQARYFENAVAEIMAWKNAEKVASLATLVAATRPGYDLEHARKTLKKSSVSFDVRYLTVPALAISSSYLRDRVSVGQSLRYLTPDTVTGYIHKHKLYGVHSSRYGSLREE